MPQDTIIDCSNEGTPLTYEGGEEVAEDAAAFTPPGHIIVMIDEATDIAKFNLGTGAGSGTFALWALCDGQSHEATDETVIATPDLRNMFVVGALDDYAVGATGGEATHILTEEELPEHGHEISDPGHSHAASQASHTHVVTDTGHTHTVTDAGHTHGLTIAADNEHDHDIDFITDEVEEASANPITVYSTTGEGTDTKTTDTEATHEHQGSEVEAAATGIAIISAATGISLNESTPLITVDPVATGISVAATGDDTAHNNLPPYYALVYIKYIG